MGQHAFQIAILLNPLGRRFRPGAGNTGNVIDLVSSQCQQIGDVFGGDTITLPYPCHIGFHPFHGIQQGDVIIH